MENWTDVAEGQFQPSQDIEITSVLAPKKRPPNPSRFKFEKVNEVTWKLTNGEMTKSPQAPLAIIIAAAFASWSGEAFEVWSPHLASHAFGATLMIHANRPSAWNQKTFLN